MAFTHATRIAVWNYSSFRLGAFVREDCVTWLAHQGLSSAINISLRKPRQSVRESAKNESPQPKSYCYC